jgi:hypothetical protein
MLRMDYPRLRLSVADFAEGHRRRLLDRRVAAAHDKRHGGESQDGSFVGNDRLPLRGYPGGAIR